MDPGWWQEDMTLVLQAGLCHQSSAFSPSAPQLAWPCQAAGSVAGSPWWLSFSAPSWQLQQMWVLPCGCYLSRSCRGPACPCPCSLLCPSTEHRPTYWVNIATWFHHPAVIWGEVKASDKKPRKTLYNYSLFTANLWSAISCYRREQGIIAWTVFKCTWFGGSLMCSLPCWETCHSQ